MEMKYSTKRKTAMTDSLNVEPQPSTSSAPRQVFVHSHTRMGKSTDEKKLLNVRREEKLLQCLKTAKDSLKALAKTSINLDQLKSKFLKNIMADTFKNQKRKPHGKRWDIKNKILSLAIFKRSPRTYTYLLKLLPLLSEITLHRIIKSIPMETGINHNIVKTLKKKKC